MKGNFEVDSLCEPLEPASLMLLCSDGLWHALDDQKIAETIIVEGDPQTACQRLVEMGAHAGDSENVTAVIVQTSE